MKKLKPPKNKRTTTIKCCPTCRWLTIDETTTLARFGCIRDTDPTEWSSDGYEVFLDTICDYWKLKKQLKMSKETR